MKHFCYRVKTYTNAQINSSKEKGIRRSNLLLSKLNITSNILDKSIFAKQKKLVAIKIIMFYFRFILMINGALNSYDKNTLLAKI